MSHARTGIFFAALLTVTVFTGLVMLVVPNVAADTTVPVNPSGIPNSGYNPSIDVSADGQRIAIAHTTSTNGLVLTFSTNGGTTWTDAATGVATAFNPVVFQFTDTRYTIVYADFTSTGGNMNTHIKAARTTNGGFSWTSSDVTTGYVDKNCDYGVYLGASAAGDAIYAIAGQAKNTGNCGNQFHERDIFVSRSPDQGATWTLNYTYSDFGNPCLFNSDYCEVSAAINPHDINNVTLILGLSSSSTGPPSNTFTNPILIKMLSGIWQGALTLQDSFTPISGPKYPLFVADEAENLTGVFVSSSSAVYNVEQIGESTFRSYSTGVTSSGVLAAYYHTNRSGLLRSVDFFDTIVLVESCDDGSTYDSFTIVQQGAGAAVSGDIAVAANSAALHITYSNGTALRYVKNDDPCGGAGGVLVNGPDAYVSVATLAGFDIDDNGGVAIVRNGTPTQRVQVYAGGVTAGNFATTNCNRLHGVASQYLPETGKQYTLFLRCSIGTPSDVSHVNIKSGSLGTPDFDSDCASGGNFCVSEMSDTELSATSEDDLLGLAETKLVPLDYSFNCISDCTPNGAAIGFVASTADGKLAWVVYLAINNLDDSAEAAFYTLNTDGNPLTTICTAQNPANNDNYAYAQGSGGAVGLKLAADFEDHNPPSFTVDLLPHFSNNVQYVSTIGMGCGGKYVALLYPTRVDLVDTSIGGLGTRQVAGTFTNGNSQVAVDPKGAVMATVDATGVITFRYTNDTTIFATRQAPTNGTAFKLEMDNYGRHAWLALSNGIAYFDLTQSDENDRYGDVTCGSSFDVDGDGIPDLEDGDLDGDGSANQDDSDADGDGLNNTVDPDDDNDCVIDEVDDVDVGPSTTAGGGRDTVPQSTGTTGPGGLLGLSEKGSLFAAIGIIAAFGLLGARFTLSNRKKGDDQ